MPFYRFGKFSAHVRLSDRKRTPPPCQAPHTWSGGSVCCAMSSRQCDAPVGDGTCDMPLCEEHATRVGPDRDLCPKHAEAAT